MNQHKDDASNTVMTLAQFRDSRKYTDGSIEYAGGVCVQNFVQGCGYHMGLANTDAPYRTSLQDAEEVLYDWLIDSGNI